VSVGVSTLRTCVLVGCGHTSRYTVTHPSRGEIGVCGYHARHIRRTFGDVEVEL